MLSAVGTAPKMTRRLQARVFWKQYAGEHFQGRGDVWARKRAKVRRGGGRRAG